FHQRVGVQEGLEFRVVVQEVRIGHGCRTAHHFVPNLRVRVQESVQSTALRVDNRDVLIPTGCCFGELTYHVRRGGGIANSLRFLRTGWYRHSPHHTPHRPRQNRGP